MKAISDDKSNVAEKLKFVFGRVEKIVGKGENAGYQHFLLFPSCFEKASLLELGLCDKELINHCLFQGSYAKNVVKDKKKKPD